MIPAIFSVYFSALQTSLARVQGLSFSLKTHNSTVPQVNGDTEDFLLYVCKPHPGLVVC